MTMIISDTTILTRNTTPISLMREQFRSFPFIVILDNPIRPSAVFSAIISVVVNSVNRSVLFAKLLGVGLVRLIHIISKLLKGLPLTPYPTTAIIRVGFMRRIVATLMYVHPNKIKSFLRQAVRSSRFTQFFVPPTTTGLGVSSFKMITSYDYNLSAITNTLPHRSSCFGYVRKLQNFQPIKLATRYIKHFHISSLAKVGKVVKENWGKFLKNKFGAKQVTDSQGNTWYEVDIKPEYKRMPIEAFGAGLLQIQPNEE